MTGIIGLLVNVLILVLIFGTIWWIITLLPLPPPFRQIATIIIALIGVLVLIGLLMGFVPVMPMHWVYRP